jgi:hypothetical protein
MQASRGTGVNNSGDLLETATTFLGSVGTFTLNPDKIDSERINISVDVNVDLKDSNQEAEILTVIMTPNSDVNRKFFMQDKDHSTLQIWQGAYQEIANLVAAEESKRLQSQLRITALSGTLAENGLDPIPGMYSVWVGYRLENGTIIFNGSPFTFEVVP